MVNPVKFGTIKLDNASKITERISFLVDESQVFVYFPSVLLFFCAVIDKKSLPL